MMSASSMQTRHHGWEVWLRCCSRISGHCFGSCSTTTRDPTPRSRPDYVNSGRWHRGDACRGSELAADAGSITADQAPFPTTGLPLSAVIDSKRDAISGQQ
jgi:hypothetical protein